MQRHKILQFLLSVPLVGDVATNLAMLARELHGQLLHRHERVYDAGQPAECMYIIVAGSIALYDPTAELIKHGESLYRLALASQ